VSLCTAKGDTICANAQAVKFGQSTPSPTASPDLLPTEPGGYSGYQALFGARYVSPQLGAGTPSLSRNGYQITDAAGNLVDLNGNEIQEPFSRRPGFPGFSPIATQSLAYMADMQEAGIPITYGYISDLHERKAYPGAPMTCTTATAITGGKPIGPGDSCYVSNAQYYDQAFNTFFQRLAADGITPANTEFVISAEENDQFVGANVGRATAPTPDGCDGVTVACHYANGQIGELAANIKGLLSTTPSSGTTFDIEPQGASLYVHGQPTAADPTVRQLERDTAVMTGNNPFTGNPNEPITKYQAGALEQRILHMQTSDVLRTPTYTLFPMPDYFFGTTGANVAVNAGFAYDHGYYSPNIDVTWVAMAGKGVAVNGVDGPEPADGNQPSDPESTHTVPQASQNGTWVEETDIRPTMLYLLGLKDDYQSDGHVITQALANVPRGLAAVEELAAAYDQLESSVGQFGTDTLIADTKALASGSGSADSAYQAEQATLRKLADDRDRVATKVKHVLTVAAHSQGLRHGEVRTDLALIRNLLQRADALAGS